MFENHEFLTSKKNMETCKNNYDIEKNMVSITKKNGNMQTYMKQTMVNMQKKSHMQTYMETNHGKHAKKQRKMQTYMEKTWQTFTYLG